jgi:hypothetical protein
MASLIHQTVISAVLDTVEQEDKGTTLQAITERRLVRAAHLAALGADLVATAEEPQEAPVGAEEEVGLAMSEDKAVTVDFSPINLRGTITALEVREAPAMWFPEVPLIVLLPVAVEPVDTRLTDQMATSPLCSTSSLCLIFLRDDR